MPGSFFVEKPKAGSPKKCVGEANYLHRILRIGKKDASTHKANIETTIARFLNDIANVAALDSFTIIINAFGKVKIEARNFFLDH